MRGALSLPFLRLYMLVFLYFSANAILNVFIPLYGHSEGVSNTGIGLIMGAYLFTTMFFRPFAGYMIEKYGAIRVLKLILLLNALALLLYTFTSPVGFAGARMLQGVCTAFFSMALQIGIMDALPEKERSQGISLYSLFSYVPGMIGPLLALAIWQSGMTYFTIVMISLALLTTLTGFQTRLGPEEGNVSPEPSEAQSQSKPSAPARLSFRQLMNHPMLLRCSLLMLVASLVFGSISTFIPLYALELAAGNAGVFLMLQAGVVVLSRFTLRKRIPSDGKWHRGFILLVMVMLASAAMCVSLSAAGGVLFFYAGALLTGLVQALLYPTLTTYLSFALPPEKRNVLLGLFIASADLGISMSGVVMGPIADYFSYTFMYMICALLCIPLLFLGYGSGQGRSAAAAERMDVQG
ncbi:staphylopine family metallophore export MFS transporter CntE [Marinicrinis sediminis]|uniref:Staphylopine family metallophore export MFS transporter CntE n=1 Tax=Marinicrinis sediminis TaxID=1652465 RepID=A0ABW5R9E7_9BACL